MSGLRAVAPPDPCRQRDRGFTLIELTVVVVVLGILVAVAIPTFLGAKDEASTASAKSRAVQAMKTQKTLYADGNGYEADPSKLAAAEPSLDFRSLGSGDVPTEVKGVVYVRDVGPDSVTVVARSPEGECYWARDDGGETEFAKGGCDAVPSTFSSTWP